MKIKHLTSKGKIIRDYFIIEDFKNHIFKESYCNITTEYLQSGLTIIAKIETIETSLTLGREIYLDEKYWNDSRNSIKARNIFLGKTSKEIIELVETGNYILTNLNK